MKFPKGNVKYSASVEHCTNLGLFNVNIISCCISFNDGIPLQNHVFCSNCDKKKKKKKPSPIRKSVEQEIKVAASNLIPKVELLSSAQQACASL